MVVIVLMGVCGSGKSTVGHALADKLKCTLSDADDFHSSENKEKMRRSIPLTDEDRLPWLSDIHAHIKRLCDAKEVGLVTCSALKKRYREILLQGLNGESSIQKNDVVFVYLKGSYMVLRERLNNRQGHFMPASLLQSQLQTLEVPDESENHITVDISPGLDVIVETIIKALYY